MMGAAGSASPDHGPGSSRIVIVGGGVAGGALAAVLARAGWSVLVLERDTVRRQCVRGEAMVPWGAVELRRLGLLDVLLAAGAHWTRRQMPYGDGISPHAARRQALDLGGIAADVPGALCLGHSAICDALLGTAAKHGAHVLQGARLIKLDPGHPPTIEYVYQDQLHRLTPDLVVGADGRGSRVARLLKLPVNTDPVHHLLGGMLVEGADDWPADEQTFGVFGNRVLYVFPQGRGRVRLYAATGYDARRSWSGYRAIETFLSAFRHAALPGGDVLARSRQAGPLQAYPNHDCWIHRPAVPGVVLIGDAAGHNDPSLGQGLALALRDVRIVSELLAETRSGGAPCFERYIQERSERLARLRFVAQVQARTRYEFNGEGRARTDRIMAACAADPTLGALFGVILQGPEAAPPETFLQSRWAPLLAA